MARPKKEVAEKRDKRITIRLSEIEYDMLCAFAQKADMPPSVYARKQILNGKVPVTYKIVVDLEQIQELTRQLFAIGNNLNQISHYFHMGGVRSKAMQDEIHACIQDIYETRKSLLKIGGEYIGDIKASVK